MQSMRSILEFSDTSTCRFASYLGLIKGSSNDVTNLLLLKVTPVLVLPLNNAPNLAYASISAST